MTETTYPFQLSPDSLPEHLRHVVVLDFREAIPPGAMCERVRTSEDGEPKFITPFDGRPRFFGETAVNDVDPVRSVGMLHVWLSGGGDVAPGLGWTRCERWEAFWEHAERTGINGPRAGLEDDSDLFAEALRYLQTPYHLSAGVTSDGNPFVVLCHPPNLYTHHGGAANRETVGIGFAWGRRCSCNPDAIVAEDSGLHADQHCARGRRDAVTTALWAAHEHYGVRTLVTHAQSSRDRSPLDNGAGGDPGTNVLWAVGWATRLLTLRGAQLRLDIDTTWGSGRGWPPDWANTAAEGSSMALAATSRSRSAVNSKSRTDGYDVADELDKLLPYIEDDRLRRLIAALSDTVRRCGGDA